MKTNLLNELKTFKKQNEDRSKTLDGLITHYETNDINQDFNERLYWYLTREENYSLRTRSLYLYLPEMGVEDEHDIYTSEICNHIAAEINFSMVLKENDTWHITMPMLPNKQGKRKSKWVDQTIGPLVRNAYMKEREDLVEYLQQPEHITVVIIHHYDKNSYKGGLIDTDNYDIKTFLDCLSPYIIGSDSIFCLDIYQRGQADTDFYTEAIIMPTTNFEGWLKANKQANLCEK